MKFGSFLRASVHMALAAFLVTACSEAAPPPAAPPPPLVTVAAPVQRTIIDRDEYVGRFVAVDSVEIRARVSGYLESVHFTDGQMVKQGDLLFTIDRRSFQNALDQATANLNQARANVAFAEADLGRAKQLVRERTISEQVFEQRTQASRIAAASVAAAEAAVRQATLDLEFTELRAPVAGRIGDRRVSPGNLVIGGSQPQTTLLATIVSIDPIRFEFTFDEASYLRYTRLASNGGKDIGSRGAKIAVELRLLDEKDFIHKGEMDFLDNVIDRSSGTIRGRAALANKDGIFTPGMFARVRVPASPPYQALMVPEGAIGAEQARRFVLVVDEKNVVRQKYVALGEVVEGMRVVTEGLAAGERVIVNGLMRARPGQPVTPQQAEAAAAPAAASSAPAGRQ